jgi:hypothetical protein
MMASFILIVLLIFASNKLAGSELTDEAVELKLQHLEERIHSLEQPGSVTNLQFNFILTYNLRGCSFDVDACFIIKHSLLQNNVRKLRFSLHFKMMLES